MKLTAVQNAHVHSLASERGGRLRPSDVVRDAQRADSPLHSLFDWDLQRAAEANWNDTAREIIGSVTYLEKTTHYTIKVPSYIRDPDVGAREQGYRSTVALRDDPVAARQSLIATLEIAAGHLRRAHDLARALHMDSEIEGLLASVAGVQRLLREVA